jgi:hypothetical protein
MKKLKKKPFKKKQVAYKVCGPEQIYISLGNHGRTMSSMGTMSMFVYDFLAFI